MAITFSSWIRLESCLKIRESTKTYRIGFCNKTGNRSIQSWTYLTCSNHHRALISVVKSGATFKYRPSPRNLLRNNNSNRLIITEKHKLRAQRHRTHRVSQGSLNYALGSINRNTRRLSISNVAWYSRYGSSRPRPCRRFRALRLPACPLF